MDFYIPQPVKSGHLRTKKRNKYGKEYVGQNELIVSAGMLNSKEMERELQRAADEADEEVVGLVTSAYGKYETPESNGGSREPEYTQRSFSGFRGTATWPPESPFIRKLQARREDPEKGESV